MHFKKSIDFIEGISGNNYYRGSFKFCINNYRKVYSIF